MTKLGQKVSLEFDIKRNELSDWRHPGGSESRSFSPSYLASRGPPPPPLPPRMYTNGNSRQQDFVPAYDRRYKSPSPVLSDVSNSSQARRAVIHRNQNGNHPPRPPTFSNRRVQSPNRRDYKDFSGRDVVSPIKHMRNSHASTTTRGSTYSPRMMPNHYGYLQGNSRKQGDSKENEPFLSNWPFKKGKYFFEKSLFLFLFIKLFLHTFCQKRTFCYPTTFFESLITHKRFIVQESYISYGKRQKSHVSDF